MQQLRPYTPEIESMMQIFYQSLSEKERRRYAAIEALKIGYGGISYIERLLGTNCRTIKRGIEELKSPSSMNQSRIRAKGGGRKRKLETIEGLESAKMRVIDRHIAGDPMDEEIRWTHLTRQEIADLLWYDHDWASLANGVVIPHGLYDLTHNLGYVQIGTDHDTSEFACDSIRYWWVNYGSWLYHEANSILLLCDGGGSNSSRSYLFKEALQALSNELGIEIRIAHYPPYTSKYNPIEHRLFPHITRAWSGVIFDSWKTVKSLIEKAKTRKGLRVFATIIEGVYETGKKVATEFKENLPIIFDEYLPQWNYIVQPQSS